jgi:glucose-6-phosphate dehydrogenase assembly protein OpcA
MPVLPVDKIQPERILKELRALWADLGKSEEHGVLRACAMTLVALVDDRDAADVSELIAALMHEHPSRAIVVRMQNVDRSELSAQVLAQCWMPFGRRQQICCEQIEIRAGNPDFDDLPSVLGGLLVPDLPVVIYCPEGSLWRSRDFRKLLPFATKVVINTAGDSDPAAVLRDAVALWRACRLTGDLAWGRLTRWRSAVAQMFDERDCAQHFKSIDRVQIQHRGKSPSTLVYLFGGWMQKALGPGIKLEFLPGDGETCCDLSRVSLTGKDLDASLEVMEGGGLQSRIGERSRRLMFPEATVYDALRQELTILGIDAQFEGALAEAAELAEKRA